MTRLYLLLFCWLLSACGASVVIQPTGIMDAENYTNEGLNAFSEDDRNRAEQLFTRALILYQSLDNQDGVLISHINLAEVSLALNNYNATQFHLDAATDIINTTLQPDIHSRITLLNSINALKQNSIIQAENFIQPLLPEFDLDTPSISPGHIQLVAIAQRTKIAFVQQQGEEQWIQRYAQALKIAAINNPALNARLLRFESILRQRKGDHLGAESKLQQALLEYKTIPSRSGIAVTLSELGQLAYTDMQWQNAKKYYKRSIAVYRYLKEFDKVSQLLEHLVDVEHASERLDSFGGKEKGLATELQ